MTIPDLSANGPNYHLLEVKIESLKDLIEQRDQSLKREKELEERALQLQAKEYERRLDDLNHAHQEAVRVQNTYVTADKYEDKLASESEARITALDRTNEKFEEYIKRYEQDKRDSELAIQIAADTAREARRIAEEHAQSAKEQAQTAAQAAKDAAAKATQDARDAAAEAIRKSNRNIGWASVGLTTIIIIVNVIPGL